MPTTTVCEVFCCLCKVRFDWNRRYGSDGVCCSKQCYDELVWRQVLSNMGKEYYPKPPAEDATRG